MNFDYKWKHGWADRLLTASDALQTLQTFEHINNEEHMKIFSMLISDDMELFELAINIIEEKSKEL